MTDLMQPWDVDRATAEAVVAEIPQRVLEQIAALDDRAHAVAKELWLLWSKYEELRGVLACFSRDMGEEVGNLQNAVAELTGLDVVHRLAEALVPICHRDDPAALRAFAWGNR